MNTCPITSVGIVGGGTIGAATAKVFTEFVPKVMVYDVDPMRSTHSFLETMEAELTFLCLPTPGGEAGGGNPFPGLNTDCLVEWFEKWAEKYPNNNYVVRSTTPIGWCKTTRDRFQIRLAHWPEFLTSRCAFVDAAIPYQNVLGGMTDHVAKIEALLKWRFDGTRLVRLSLSESEAVKIFTNSFFAMKVSIFNEFFSICGEAKLNYSSVVKALLGDARISPSHTVVPGPDGLLGYGGECLPKDISELVNKAWELNLSAHMAEASIRRNRFDRDRWTPEKEGEKS